MNQIIYPNNSETSSNMQNTNILKIKYKLIFFISSLLALIFIFYYVYLYINIYKKEKEFNKILNAYDIQLLYSSNKQIELPSVILETGDMSNVLGIIEIKKIGIRYPILSVYNEKFLEIAPCKFYGGTLNEIGNFCIAGHNYDNDMFFSNLNLLRIGDLITVYTLDR